jgi:hypothetical protein
VARADLRQAHAAGDTERFESISIRYVASLAERAVPEWQATLDALQKLPEIGTDPIQFLLPWDDEHVDRQSTLALFDAFASRKTLHANPGDHRTIRSIGVDSEFLAGHLGLASTSPA